jgi:hypothetical protein
MESPDPGTVRAYVAAASDLLAMPLDPERAENVAVTLALLDALAANVAEIALADDVEVAGVFVP